MAEFKGYFWYREFTGKTHTFWGKRTWQYDSYSERKAYVYRCLEAILHYLYFLEQEDHNLQCWMYQEPEHDSADYIHIVMRRNDLCIRRSYSIYEFENSRTFEGVRWEVENLYTMLMMKVNKTSAKEMPLRDDEFNSWNDDPGYY